MTMQARTLTRRGTRTHCPAGNRRTKSGLCKCVTCKKAIRIRNALAAAKIRAFAKSVPFDLVPEDIHIPAFCPALGIPLFSRDQSGPCPNSPSIDRIIPSLGYVKGNVVVISNRANLIKQNATAEEIIAVGEWLRSMGGA